MPELLWMGLNLLVGVPLALGALVLLREALRTLVAVALGQRVFEVQWGAGRRRFARPIGSVDLAIAAWPLAGAALAHSASPRRHLLVRVLLATAPPLAQLGWIAMRSALEVPFPWPPPSGWDPLAIFDLANAGLLVLHAVVPVELSPGVRTDVRLLLDALTEPAEAARAGRASYYARLVRHHVERDQVARARDALARGLTQLGPEPTLIGCRELLDGRELDSVIDQDACADAIESLIRDAEPQRANPQASRSFGQRLGHGLLGVVPATLALASLGVIEAERLAAGVEAGLRRSSARAAQQADPARCAALIDYWAGWSDVVELESLPADRRRDRHAELARLEACRGNPAGAEARLGEALLAATQARTESATLLAVDLERWVANELRLGELLRDVANGERRDRHYRRALATLHRAQQQLDRTRRRLASHPDDSGRGAALARVLEVERGLSDLRDDITREMRGG